MPRQTKRPAPRGPRTASDDIMHSLRELAAAVEQRQPLDRLFTARTVTIPEPGHYSPTAIKRLRSELGMSQPVFAELLGVSRILVQGWERGIRHPSPLARRLLDTIRNDPSAWLASAWSKAG